MATGILAPAPVVIVTGANGGVGYGVCQRLLVQLYQKNAPDALPQAFVPNADLKERAPAGYQGITLILACRNTKRGVMARANLVAWLDDHIATLLKACSEDDGDYIRDFRCDIQVLELDLASVTSALRFADTLRKRVPYVSHLVCNAGVASFSGMDWIACLKQFMVSPMSAITAPGFYLQHMGEISADNLGWVWQSNVFGHFILFRELEDLLRASPFDSSRVIWCSSLEASPKFYDSKDWQLKSTEHSYESTKYQIDLIATCLDQLATSVQPTSGKPVRHFVSEPGVCSTSISRALVGPVLDYLKVFAFYVGRMFGSPHHSIVPYKAAIATVHLILVPIVFLAAAAGAPVRYGAQTGRWGDERVGVSPVKEWTAHKEEGTQLIARCDALYQSFKADAETLCEFERASEQM
ncbi:hypothetical protein HYPSUDRAFT_140311 [Hypholoma sublateritium FD-334 SS-4]|uniref:3-keto sterol reductase n=1 Tax=Hypholoma sublateritium (strain FD-334 SS-4) TaxID=945553 RepID=A0A0D2L4D0_HYPSF|nr:hypothetical protein HYPSUDRAFT_140311 [Hypholoma sublateritium FD-334 SS-4]